MIRLIAGLIGLGFVGILLISMITNLAEYFGEEHTETAEHAFHLEPKDVAFSFSSPVGKFDRAQLQRGFQVYKEVCAACHGLELVAFRDLAALGYNEAEVKAIANQWAIEVPSINPDTGEAATRKATPADRFPSPYANETAARAANANAYPPDLSLIAKNREGGPHYVYSLLTGYKNAATYRNKEGKPLPAENRPAQGLHFNPYFANLNIAMPPPITSDGQVTYAQGNPAPTVDQMSKDVSAFLMWAAEPKLENRHKTGWATVIFLLVGTILGYLSYRNIWATAKRKVRVTGPLEAESQAKSRAAKAEQGIAG
jgi:ubiquinol-cytochrome c reductase cytochrome c1 subunit